MPCQECLPVKVIESNLHVSCFVFLIILITILLKSLKFSIILEIFFKKYFLLLFLLNLNSASLGYLPPQLIAPDIPDSESEKSQLREKSLLPYIFKNQLIHLIFDLLNTEACKIRIEIEDTC